MPGRDMNGRVPNLMAGGFFLLIVAITKFRCNFTEEFCLDYVECG